MAGLRLQRLAEEEMDRGRPVLRARPVGFDGSVRRGESTAARLCANTRYKEQCVRSENAGRNRGFVGAQHRQLQPNEMTKVMRKFVSKARDRALALKVEVIAAPKNKPPAVAGGVRSKRENC